MPEMQRGSLQTNIVHLFAAAAIPLFCTNPYKAICNEDLRRSYTSRQERIDQIGDDFRDIALSEIAKEFELDELDESDLENIEPLESRNKYYEKYYTRIEGLLKEYLQKNKVTIDVNELKKDMVAAAKARGHATLQTELAIIDKVQMLLPDEKFFDAKQSDDFKKLRHECGRDGMVDNAFADTLYQGQPNEQPVVMICPGAIIASVEFVKELKLPRTEAVTVLAMTLGHEFGHHIDSDTFPDVFKPLESCIADGFSTKFIEAIPEYMREISADTYGNQVLAARLSRAKMKDRVVLLEGGLEDMCDSPDDKEHPSGFFRIATLAFSSASLRATLQCGEPKRQLVCPLP